MKRLDRYLIVGIVLIAAAVLLATATFAQVAEARLTDQGTELHLSPLPDRIAFEIAAEDLGAFHATSEASVTEGGSRHGERIYVDGFRDDAVYNGIVVEMEPRYSHIGTIEASGALAIGRIQIDGEVVPWTFLSAQDVPAWDAELRATIDSLAAIAGEYRSERDLAIQERDAATEALDPVLAERDALAAEVDALRAAAEGALQYARAALEALRQ